MPSSDFSQGTGALKIARLVCLQKKIVVIITTQLKTSRRTPIANNPRHVPVCIVWNLNLNLRLYRMGSRRHCGMNVTLTNERKRGLFLWRHKQTTRSCIHNDNINKSNKLWLQLWMILKLLLIHFTTITTITTATNFDYRFGW